MQSDVVKKNWSRVSTEHIRVLEKEYTAGPISLHHTKIFVNTVKKYISELKPSSADHISIMDVGIGTGEIAIPLHDAGFNVSGIDISGNMLEFCKTKLGNRKIDTTLADIFEYSSTTTNKYDVVTCRYVFPHYESAQQLLCALSALIKPGGLLFFDDFSKDSIYSAAEAMGTRCDATMMKLIPSLYAHSAQEIADGYDAAGLKLVAQKPLDMCHCNPWFALSFEQVADYTQQIIRFYAMPEVAEFITWLQENQLQIIPYSQYGLYVNVAMKI